MIIRFPRTNTEVEVGDISGLRKYSLGMLDALEPIEIHMEVCDLDYLQDLLAEVHA